MCICLISLSSLTGSFLPAKIRRGRLNHRHRGGSNLLSNQNKALAKSTTALNVEPGPSRVVCALRGIHVVVLNVCTMDSSSIELTADVLVNIQ